MPPKQPKEEPKPIEVLTCQPPLKPKTWEERRTFIDMRGRGWK